MTSAWFALGTMLLVSSRSLAQGPDDRPPALEELAAAAKRDSNDAGAHYALAMAFWERKQWDAAERALREAIVIAPGYAEAHLALSQLGARRGDKYWKQRIKREGEPAVRTAFLESESHYRRAFLLNPLVDLRVLGKVDIKDRLTFVPVGDRILVIFPPWWGEYLEKAINELHAGRYEKGFERIEQLAQRKEFGGSDENLPDQILWYHGLIAAHLNRRELAIRDFGLLTGRAYAAEQDTSAFAGWQRLKTNDYRFILATLLYLSGRYDQAAPTYRRALEFDIGLYVAHVQLARMLETTGEMQEALVERQRALDANPEDPDLLVDLAGTLIKASQLTDALEPLANAARLNPRDPRVPYLQGLVAWQLKQADASREAFSRFVAIAPSRFAPQIEDARKRLAALQ